MAGRPRISFNTIVPKKGFLFDLFAEEIKKTMRDDVKRELKFWFNRTTSGWEHSIGFRGTIKTVQGKSIRLLVQPDGPNKWLYELVARGADPHDITPVNANYLKFQAGYIAGTTPYSLRSRRKVRFGDTVYTKRVRHPGFEGRYWDFEIARLYEERFVQLMQGAVRNYQIKQQQAFKQKQKSPNPTPVARR